MGECAKCKNVFAECDLMWVDQPREPDIQIIWTGRGQDESKKKKIELLCKQCLEEIKKEE